MSVDAVLIAGPTASGKSAVAVELAEWINGVIVNADSMQVYSDLAVLTARPTSSDRARAPHRLYGHVKATERYSVGRYQVEAAGALDEARRFGRVPIFTGGTGLYFEALVKGLSPIPPVPAETRAEVRRKFEEMGRAAFLDELAHRDPATASKLPNSDTQRLLRAMDVLEGTERPLSEWQALSGKPVLDGLRLARFVISPPRDILNERADRRFEIMVRSGGLEEARALSGLDATLPAAKALGVPQLRRHLAGEIALETAIEEAQLATKHYVKRQITWFRKRMTEWNWLSETNLRNIVTSIQQELS